MQRREPLIYSGRISADDLLGVPDLLRKEAGGYVPGDIKSGAGEEGGGDDSDGNIGSIALLASVVFPPENRHFATGRQARTANNRPRTNATELMLTGFEQQSEQF
jgi:hypothetical protein